MKKLLLLFILLIPLVSAQSWMHTSETAHMNLKLESEVELVQKYPGQETADYLEVQLLFFPKEDPLQSVGTVSISPANHEVLRDMIKFNWDQPTESVFSYKYEADVAVTNNPLPIRRSIPYPIIDLPNEFVQYTLPTEQIDATYPKIMDIANKLSAGQTDLFLVTHKVGAWVKDNIDYSLNTLTAEAAQKASWVIEHEYGVCDEITTLFIAMMRSLGIPARYVSGVAYTNWQEMNDWGSHAWSEVYFPGYGWLPFDITYGQIGLIDNSHISLKKSSDVDSTSTKFEWLGANLELQTKTLDIKTELTRTTGHVSIPLDLEISLYRDEVGFGSYNIVEAEVKNLAGYYYPTQIALAKTQGLETVGDELKHVLLKPGESKTLTWIVRVTPTLDRDYTYSFPIEVYTTRNKTISTSFSSKHKAPRYNYDDIKDLIAVEEQPTPTKDVILVCSAQKQDYYLDQEITASCDVIASEALTNLNVCMLGQCQKISLGEGDSETLTFSFNLNATGRRDIIVTAKNSEVSKATSFDLNMYTRPKLTIEQIEAPKVVRYGDVFDLSFVLMKEEANPQNVVIRLDQDGTLQRWRVEELVNNKKFIITTDTRGYKEGANTYNIIVTYEDNDGNEYAAKESLSISLIDVTPLQKFQIMLNRFGKWLHNVLS